jgi:hypothetical protein
MAGHPEGRAGMSAAAGWIKLHRSLADHPIWLGERFTRGQAWVDLLMLAAFEEHEAPSYGFRDVMRVKRGQVLTSQVRLAERWGWDRRTVRMFLRNLERRGMVLIEGSKDTHTGFTLVTIRKYDPYQNTDAPTGASNSPSYSPSRSPAHSPSTPHPLPTSEEGRERKEGKEKKEPHASPITNEQSAHKYVRGAPAEPEGFADFYTAYPNKKARAEAERAWVKCGAGPDAILRATIMEALGKQQAWREAMAKAAPDRFIPEWPYPATWLNGKRWTDGLDPIPVPGTALVRPIHTASGRTAGNNAAIEEFKARMRRLQ